MPFCVRSQAAQKGLSDGQLAAAIVVPVVVCIAVAAAAAVWLLLIRPQRHRGTDLLGRVLPPPPSPQTTLMISDIQSSTTL